MSHTPGPWNAEYDDYGDEIWFGGYDCGTWKVGPAYLGGHGNDPVVKATMEADARLISAAPDLLAACEIAENLADAVARLAPEKVDRFKTLEALGVIRAAIAKARGKPLDTGTGSR